MKRKLLIRDLTLRDGQQSQFATRMTQEQIDRVLPFYKDAHFYATEVWGGAIPDSVMRYLNENPWDRLEKIKAALGDSTLLTALSRGRNLFGYNPYPEEAIEGFSKNAIQSGLGIMRIFDCLNDINNMKSTIKYVQKYGGIVDCAVCYTVDPKFTWQERAKGFFTGKKIPGKIFTIDYFIDKAVQLEQLGANMITMKDMAGLIPPQMAGPIVKGIKSRVKIPLDIHTHCTPGYGLAAILVSMINGVDIVDAVIGPFAGGPAAPAFEFVQMFADRLGLDTGVDLNAVAKINKELYNIRRELAAVDKFKRFPREFDISNPNLPNNVNKFFDDAVEAAKSERYEELIEKCNKIDEYFNFPPANERVKEAEIPGGMFTNMLAQLQAGKLENMFNRVLEIVPTVRLQAGLPPLVTPTSQIVGVQAVNCVMDESKGKPWYTNKSIQFVNLVKGNYGKTPWPVDPDFRESLCGVREEKDYDVSSYTKPENPVLPQFGGVRLAENEKEMLLLELFPAVAKGFLLGQKERRFRESIIRQQEEKMAEIEEERKKYDALTEDEKQALLMDGLYNQW